MTWRSRLRRIGLVLAGLALVLVATGIVVTQTGWFREYVRGKIISATEEATGGRVEVGAFSFSPWRLEAVVTNLVIHGREPQGGDPFVRVARVQLNIRLLTSLRRLLDLSYLGVDRPQVNVFVMADGETNLPQPKTKAPSGNGPLDTVINLAVDRFLLSRGVITFNSRPQAIDVQANNLHVVLDFNSLTRAYRGELSLQPVYVTSGRNTPVVFTVVLPVVLERDRVALENARIATPASYIGISGSLEDFKNPKIDAKVNGHVAVADVRKFVDVSLDTGGAGLPKVVTLEASAAMENDRIQVSGLRVGAGKSDIEASGTLKGPEGNHALQFKASLALDEIGRMVHLEARPAGLVLANGSVRLDGANRYFVEGEVEGRGVSFSSGARRFQNVNLRSAVSLNPQRLELNGLQVTALGGQFHGNASLEEFARYAVNGDLRGFDLHTVMTALGQKPLPYDASVSGTAAANGDLKSSGKKLAAARANLAIAPSGSGIPVSGRIRAQYRGDSGNVEVIDSYLALPKTRLALNGSLNNRLNVELTSNDLTALLAAAGPSPPPVKLEGGQARLTGYVNGAIQAPHLYAQLAVPQFSVQGRHFDSLSLEVDAAQSGVSVSNGRVQRGAMQTVFAASAGLDHWSAKPSEPLQATASVRNGDLADVLALAGQSPAGFAGALSANLSARGTLGNPEGSANLEVSNGKIKDEPFDRIQATVNLSDQRITVPSASISAGNSQVQLTAEFQHPRDSLATGALHAHLQSNQLNLEQLRTLTQVRPGLAGTVTLTADVRGSLTPAEFVPTAIEADASARGLKFDGQAYGDATLKASTSGSTVRYDLVTNFAGSDTRVDGTTQLTKGYPTTANATLRNLPVERVLAVARENGVPVKGVLSGTAHITGTLDDPQGSADLDLANAVVYEQPIDRVRLQATYLARRIDVPLIEVTAGPSHVQLAGTYDHPAGDFGSGDVTFRLENSQIDLAHIRKLQELRPGLAGVVSLAAAGGAKIQAGSSQILLRDLSADVSTSGIAVQGARAGDLTLKAGTNAGRLSFTLDSTLAGARINAKGTTQLTRDYPTDAQLSFSDVSWSGLRPLVSPGSATPRFEADTEGQVTLKGPLTKVEALQGSLRISALHLVPKPRPGAPATRTAIQNQGPLVATLDHGLIRIDSAHLTGPQTDVGVTGTISVLQPQVVKLNIKANTELGFLQDFDRDIFASGQILLAAAIGGTLTKPDLNGSLELKRASLNYLHFPNGLSDANGEIVFNGSTATIRSLTGESGGGKITLAGFVTYADVLRVGIRATANNVRIRPQSGISVVANASLNLTGTAQASRASGTVTIVRLTYAPQSDFGSILARAAPPVQSAEAPDSFLENMRLDIRVRTSSGTAVQASLAENLQVDGDLRIRGTAARPGMLGRLSITSGELVFFGSKYRVNTGTVGFFDPLRIEPVLNFSLETQAKGVNVVLNVTGPVDNMKLSYTSEPPLQFQEIINLLATGKTPTSDPTLLANQPSQPQQNFQQMGESALVAKTLADPVASRLQRVFGISQLKIDPSFTSGSNLPQARVTLQQQVTSNLTFTYITALDDPNAQIVRVEWAVSPQWSAVANRDQNGIFSISLFYKKQFR
jgi:autotransporter translocation and assembly factor TamB